MRFYCKPTRDPYDWAPHFAVIPVFMGVRNQKRMYVWLEWVEVSGKVCKIYRYPKEGA